MTKKQKAPFEEINWPEFQKRYMEALMAFNASNPFSQKSQTPFDAMNPFIQMSQPSFDPMNPFMQMSNPAFGSFNPFTQPAKPSLDSFWVNAMNDWWKLVKSDKPQEYENLFEKVLDQCRNYYFMSEQFSNLIEGMADSKKKNENVTSFINKKFKEIEASFLASQNNVNWSSFVDSCEQPVELLKNTFANMSHSSNDMFSGVVSPEARKVRDRFLSVPGVGYSRETQDKYLEAIKLWANYQDNHQEYQTVMAQLNHDALELMRKRIIQMTKKGEDINSMREIYDLWVDSNEKVYGDYVYTEEYSELNGRVVNSLMAFKKKSHEITEDILSAMNMPTSKAVDELERRHNELRKQIKAMQLELKDLKKQSQEKGGTTAAPVTVARATVSRTKKKTKKSASQNTTKVVQFKQAKKKVTKSAKPAKKKTKQKSVSTTADKGMIELKF